MNALRWCVADGGWNGNGELFDGSTADEMCCGDESGILIPIENRVAGHGQEGLGKGGQRPVGFLSCFLNDPMVAGRLFSTMEPLGR